MSNMVRCSFVLTVRNGDQFLNECIQSVLDNYPEVEFVIVDDGSTDGTAAILEDWESKAPQIQVISTAGVGRGAALNLAVNATSRPYIANIDADDLALPGREVLVEFLERADESVALAAGTSHLKFEGGETVGDYAKEEQSYRAGPSFIEVAGRLHRGNPLSHISVVMRREAVMTVGGYDERRQSQVDYELWIRLSKQGYRLFRAEIPVAIKRLHDSQSFELRGHVKYVLRGMSVRITAATTLRMRAEAVAVSVPKLIWALFPRGVRIMLMNQGMARTLGGWLREGSLSLMNRKDGVG